MASLDDLMTLWMADMLSHDDEYDLVSQIRKMTNSQLFHGRSTSTGRFNPRSLFTSGIEPDDIYQIVFLHVHKNRHRWIPGKGKASTWLYWAIRSAISEIKRGDAIKRRNVDLGTFFISPEEYRAGMVAFKRDAKKARGVK